MNSYALKFSLAFSTTLMVCVAVTVFWASNAFGQLSLGPYGGRIMYTVYCTCSGTLLHTLGGPSYGEQVIYAPGRTQLFAYYMAFAAPPWQLGNKGIPEQCLVYGGNNCFSEGQGYVMSINGTSLY